MKSSVDSQPSASAPNQLFVGGLPKKATNEALQTYFKKFGKVLEARIVIDKVTGLSRGFAFVTMSAEKEVKKVLQKKKHKFLSTTVSIKEAITRTETMEINLDEKERKIFVVGLPYKTKQEDMIDYFSKYGEIQKIELKAQKRFGFVLFKERLSVIELFNDDTVHKIFGEIIECRPILMRSEVNSMKTNTQIQPTNKMTPTYPGFQSQFIPDQSPSPQITTPFDYDSSWPYNGQYPVSQNPFEQTGLGEPYPPVNTMNMNMVPSPMTYSMNGESYHPHPVQNYQPRASAAFYRNKFPTNCTPSDKDSLGSRGPTAEFNGLGQALQKEPEAIPTRERSNMNSLLLAMSSFDYKTFGKDSEPDKDESEPKTKSYPGPISSEKAKNASKTSENPTIQVTVHQDPSEDSNLKYVSRYKIETSESRLNKNHEKTMSFLDDAEEGKEIAPKQPTTSTELSKLTLTTLKKKNTEMGDYDSTFLTSANPEDEKLLSIFSNSKSSEAQQSVRSKLHTDSDFASEEQASSRARSKLSNLSNSKSPRPSPSPLKVKVAAKSSLHALEEEDEDDHSMDLLPLPLQSKKISKRSGQRVFASFKDSDDVKPQEGTSAIASDFVVIDKKSSKSVLGIIDEHDAECHAKTEHKK